MKRNECLYCAIGNNNEAANSYLKEKYKEGLKLEEGLDLACQTLAKALTSTLSHDKGKT